MTLRTAARLGVAGSAMPFALIVAWFVVATVVGMPMAGMPFHADPLALVLGYPAPAAVCGFLVVLYCAAAGLTQPSRLGDAALAASVVAMVTLAVDLRWMALAHFFSGPVANAMVWLYRAEWLAARVLVPVAWLVFLVTFVRWPAPPLARGSCRAAAWLAIAMAVGGVWPVWRFVETLLGIFWWRFPASGSHFYYAWPGVVSGFLEALRWVLMLVFALGVWRIPPAAEPPTGA